MANASEPERVGADGVGSHTRKVALALFLGAPAEKRVVDEGVLHVNDHSGGGVGAGQFFHSDNRLEEFTAATAILFGNLDAHQAKLEKLVNQLLVEDAFLVHFFGPRADALLCELSNIVAKEDLVLGQGGEGRGVGRERDGFRHTNTFTGRVADFEF